MFGNSVNKDAKEHALECYPLESCGIVLNGEYVPLANKEKAPYAARIDYNKDMEAFIHSHPDHPPSPSKTDMASQISAAVPYGIVSLDRSRAMDIEWFGDQAPVAPFTGRTFLFGVRDCFNLCRDVYRKELGITIRQIPRDPFSDVLRVAEFFSLQNFQSLGFEQVWDAEKDKEYESWKPYDGLLVKYMERYPGPTHVALYRGEGKVLHHVMDRLSVEEPVERMASRVQHVLRHKDMM